MSIEKQTIDRRTFLTAGAAALTAIAAAQGFQLASDYIDHSYKKEKFVEPRYRNTVDSTPLFLGIYPQANNPKQVSRSENFNVVGYFSPWKDWAADGDIDTFAEGQVPMISVIPYFETNKKRPFRYKDLIEQRGHIREQAKKLQTISKRTEKLLFRYGYEMNGDWFAHGSNVQSPQEFIDGWRLVTEIVKEENPDIKTVWSPNVDYPIEPYYPWDNDSELEPDYVGLDGYNKHHLSPFHIRHLHPNPSFTQLFGKDVLTLQEMTEKPILITEVGIDYGNSQQSRVDAFHWMINALSTAATYDRVEGVCVFAWNKSRGRFDFHEGDWGNVLTEELYDSIEQNPLYSRPQPWRPA